MTTSFSLPGLIAYHSSSEEKDNFHYLPVDLYNQIHLDFFKDKKVQIEKKSGFKISTNHENFIYKSIKKLLDTKPNRKGIHIKIDQNIPSYSGLNDELLAAAVLLIALNKKWDFNLSDKQLGALALEVDPRLPSLLNFVQGSVAIDEKFIILIRPKYISANHEWIASMIKKTAFNSCEELMMHYFPDILCLLNKFKAYQLKAGMSGLGPMLYGISESNDNFKKIAASIENKVDFIYMGKACQLPTITI